VAIQPVQLKAIREMIGLAQTGPAAALPDETHQSYPIPVPASGGSIRIAFLFAPSHLQRGVGLVLAAPNYAAFLSAATGEVLEKGAVTPADLGVRNKAGEVLGPFVLPARMSGEDYAKEREHLYDAYDVLLAAWASGQRGSNLDRRTRSAAQDFVRLFARLSEPPLAPYYRSVGKDFFPWVERAT
jgi:hypothetical protein